MGAVAGEETELHEYYIATEGLSIVRIDLIYWCRNIVSAGIMKHGEKSIVCTAVKSSVDLTKIDFNSFLSSYSAQLARCEFSDKQLKEEIINAQEIYTLLTAHENKNIAS